LFFDQIFHCNIYGDRCDGCSRPLDSRGQNKKAAALQLDRLVRGSTGIAFTPSSGSRSTNLTGWTAGGSGEWAFAPNVSANVEYVHYDLGTMHYSANKITDISAPCAGPPNTPFASPSAEFKGDLVRVGLNFKIGQ
jgi:opacity protein-like surface antigen